MVKLRARITIILWSAFNSFLIGQMPALEMMGAKDRISFPFEYYNNFIVVDVLLAEALPMRFIFDTGAENTILFEKTYSDLLGIPIEQKIKIYGADLNHTVDAYISRRVLLRLNKLPLFHSDIIILEEDIYHMEHYLGLEIDGILGSNLFCGLVVDIDYRARRITINKPKRDNSPGKKYTGIDMTVKNCKPYVDLPTVCNGSKSDSLRYLLDTGAGVTMLVHNNTHETLNLPSNYIKGHLGSGIGGSIEGYLGRMEKLIIGKYVFNHTICNFQDLDSLATINLDTRRNGLLGNVLLSRFDIRLDYSQNKLWIRSNRNYKKAIRVDRSGLYLLATGHHLNQYIIQHVIPGSPADLAGIKRGDLIYRMNGIPSAFLSLARIIRKLQKKPGRTIRLGVIRNAEKINVSFDLKDLI